MRKILLYFMLVMILVFGSTSSIQAKSIRTVNNGSVQFLVISSGGGPVSYTHLDVYKRQDDSGGSVGGSLQRRTVF